LGRPVHIVDKDEKRLGDSIKSVEKFRRDWPAASNSVNWGNIITYPSTQLAKSLANSWMVVEVRISRRLSVGKVTWLTTVQCVPESLSLKKTLVKELDALSNPDVIVASNSSSYTISEIVEDLQLKHPERCVSLHSCKSIPRQIPRGFLT
jgi:hypothetical protein